MEAGVRMPERVEEVFRAPIGTRFLDTRLAY